MRRTWGGVGFECVFHLIRNGCNFCCGPWISLRFRWFYGLRLKLSKKCLFENFGLGEWENFEFEAALVKTRVSKSFVRVWMDFEGML
jgi:hypothetical protein